MSDEKSDIPSTRAVLRRLFLTLFLRGRSSRGLQKDQAPKSVGSKLIKVLLFYAAFGLLGTAFRSQGVFLLSAYLHAMTLMFLGMFLASSAGEVLFNREEADILMHRPIEPRALLWAKVWVMAEVSLWLAGAFNLAGFFAGATSAKGGLLYVPAHAASMAMQAFFCTGCVVLVYQLCLRWFGRERLEGLMTTAQVLFSVAVMVGSQMMPEIMKVAGKGADVKLESLWWAALLPPAWFAGFDDAIAGTGARTSWWLAGVGCSATAAVLWLAFGKLARDYEAGLQTLNEGPTKLVKSDGVRRRLGRLTEMWPLNWWLRDPRERATFLLVSAYLLRDRDVKLRVYPAVAPFLMLPVIFMVRDFSSGGDKGPMAGFGVVLASSYVAMLPMMALNLLQYSQHWRAADLFRTAPMDGPGPICMGATKAVLLFLALPLAVMLAAATWLIKGDLQSVALIVPGLLCVPVMALMPSVSGGSIPLSSPVEEAKGASRGLMMVGSMFGAMALSGIALAASKFGLLWLMILVETAVMAVVFVAMRIDLTRKPWPTLE